jgi:GT2 family glycosyltransferase
MLTGGFSLRTTCSFTLVALKRCQRPSRGDITLSSMFPYWQAFCLGYEAVRAVGLFDEGFFPAYFEDTDYIRRALAKNVPIVKLDVALEHDNSSTIQVRCTVEE